MIALNEFTNIFAAVTPGGDIEALIPVVRTAVRAGIGVVLIEPRGKKAICTLTARALREADEAAQLAGRRHHACGVKHPLTDIDEVNKVMARMRKRYVDPPPNVAIVPGLSRLISVDVDTPEQLTSFRTAWSLATGDRRYLQAAPTVTSPGSRGPSGQMSHHGGGHFHFVVPDDFNHTELERNKYVDQSGWVAEYGDSVYLLVPPSVRQEGPYRVTGDVYEAPAFLLDLIHAQHQATTQKRAERAERGDKAADDPIEQWVREDHFEQIMTDAGWTEAGSAHNCGCPDWTRPGDWSTPVSATLHQAGCIDPRYTLDEGVQVLHIWTDDPQPPFHTPIVQGTRTFTQLDAYAWAHHDGDRAAAMRGLGLASNRPQLDVMKWARESAVSTNGHHRPDPPPDDLLLPNDWWEARPLLSHIRTAAQARMASPASVLGVVLARVVSCSPHTLRIPGIIGGDVGLSLLVGLTGPPSAGKSISNKVGGRLVRPPADLDVADNLPSGSGEGLVEVLFDMVSETDPDTKKRIKVKKQVRHNAYVYVDEGEVVAEMGRRKGTILLPTLRTIFTHEKIGQINAAADRRRVVDGDAYVYGVVLAIQPEKAEDLLADHAGGTPQRFIWMPADTSDAIVDELPDWPGELSWMPPSVDGHRALFQSTGQVAREVDVAPSVRDEVLDLRRRVMRHQVEIDSLDVHRNLIKLKVAAVLGILDHRAEVNEEDWQLAEGLLWLSDVTRARVQYAIEASRGRRDEFFTRRHVHKEAEAHRVKHEIDRVVICVEKIIDRVAETEESLTRSELYRAMKRYRDVLDDALAYGKTKKLLIEVNEPTHTDQDRRVIRLGEDVS